MQRSDPPPTHSYEAAAVSPGRPNVPCGGYRGPPPSFLRTAAALARLQSLRRETRSRRARSVPCSSSRWPILSPSLTCTLSPRPPTSLDGRSFLRDPRGCRLTSAQAGGAASACASSDARPGRLQRTGESWPSLAHASHPLSPPLGPGGGVLAHEEASSPAPTQSHLHPFEPCHAAGLHWAPLNPWHRSLSRTAPLRWQPFTQSVSDSESTPG